MGLRCRLFGILDQHNVRRSIVDGDGGSHQHGVRGAVAAVRETWTTNVINIEREE
jgi:hypothetical protein